MGKAYIIKQSDTGTITQAVTTAFHTPVAIKIATEVSPDNKPLGVTSYPLHLSGVYIHVHAIAASATNLSPLSIPRANHFIPASLTNFNKSGRLRVSTLE